MYFFQLVWECRGYILKDTKPVISMHTWACGSVVLKSLCTDMTSQNGETKGGDRWIINRAWRNRNVARWDGYFNINIIFCLIKGGEKTNAPIIYVTHHIMWVWQWVDTDTSQKQILTTAYVWKERKERNK